MSRPLSALTALSLALALACARETPAPTPTPDAPAPDAPKAPPETSAVDAAKARGELRVAADPDAPPFLSKDGKGEWEGYEYAIARAIADGVGVPLTIVPTTFSKLVDTVTTGQADLAIGQLAPSHTWQGVDWSVSYLQYSLCLVVPAGSTAELRDLKGKRVGMYDDPVARQLTDMLIGASYERVIFDDYGYFEKMVRGQLDAMVYDCPLARHEIKTFGDELRIADANLNVSTYAVAVPEGDTETLALVNGVLRDLGEKGLLATLQERVLGEVAREGQIATATGKVVVVRKGDTLSLIAGRELGSTEKWRELHAANQDVVGPDPNVIYAGMRLRLPK